MFDYQLAGVEKRLRRLYQRGVLYNKKIYIFGVSENTRQIIQILRSYRLEPINVIDNDKKKQDSYCSEIRVISADKVDEIDSVKNLYILYSGYWREMAAQLRNHGVKKENILTLYKKETLGECLIQAYRGKRIYEKLINKYGNVPVFVCPYTGTGDIYLLGTFWKQYMEKDKLEDYVFLVLSKACEKVAKLFEIKNLEVFQRKAESQYLIRYYMMCREKVNIKLLNDSWAQIHTNPLEWFRGYKGLEFTELFRRFVFELPATAKPEHPVYQDAGRELEALFQEYGLKEGNTVVLSPYSNTLADLPKEFWIHLAKELKGKGFRVCTNSSGNSEPGIAGTIPVFFPLNIAPQWIERAGYFVGVRSGFCDVVSGTRAKKVVLYSSQDRFFNGSAFEYFNLKDMELSGDTAEILFDRNDYDGLTKKVMEGLGIMP